MNSLSTFNRSIEPDGKIVSLNQDIGFLLIKYLKGLDVINFMEAVNGSEQFKIIEISEDYRFYRTFMKFVNKEKLALSLAYIGFYLETCCLGDDGYLYPQNYHQGEAPVLRLFIQPTFTVEAFENVCYTYMTSSFQCYSRLLSFNTCTYAGNFILVDYFNYNFSIGRSRELNVHERSLFKESISEFMTNFEIRFKLSSWIKAIDFTKFHVSGGCIINSLCKHPFPDTSIQQVDINFNGNLFDRFDDEVASVFNKILSIISKDNRHLSTSLMKRGNGSYFVVLPPFNVQLQFNFKNVPDNTDPVSYVLHGCDIDISQVAFTVCTFAFLQAIATRSFVCYTMHATMMKSIYNRIIRYCQRGFIFLEPQGFDDVSYIDIMADTVLDESREETKEIINDDGEIQTITTTYRPHRWPLPNVDPHLLQETFIKQIVSQKFE